MIVDYRLDVKDLELILPYMHWNAPAAKRFRCFLYGICAVLAAVGLIMAVGSFVLADDMETALFWGDQGFSLVFWSVAWALVNLLLFPLGGAGAARRLLKKDAGQAGDYRVELGDQGLTEYSVGRTLWLNWRRLRKLAVHKKYLYIYRDHTAATVIPLRAFENQAHGEEFLRLLKAGSGLRLNIEKA